MSSVGSVNEAVGSGIRGGRSWLDALGEAVDRVSAGVPAREEGYMGRGVGRAPSASIFNHIVEQERLFEDIR